jgi:hypothetical protein
LRQRSNHRANHSFKNWLRWLQKLWKSLIRSLRIFFTTDLGEGYSRRSLQSHRNEDLKEKSNLSNESSSTILSPTSFLLGLEDIPNLEFLTTKELIEQIEWNAESQEILTAKEEDLTLLEDLLVNFPES